MFKFYINILSTVLLLSFIHNLFEWVASASRFTHFKCLVSFLPSITNDYYCFCGYCVPQWYGGYERAYQDTHHDIYDEPACKPFSNLCRDKYCKSLSDLLLDISVWNYFYRVNTRLVRIYRWGTCEKCHAMHFRSRRGSSILITSCIQLEEKKNHTCKFYLFYQSTSLYSNGLNCNIY